MAHDAVSPHPLHLPLAAGRAGHPRRLGGRLEGRRALEIRQEQPARVVRVHLHLQHRGDTAHRLPQVLPEEQRRQHPTICTNSGEKETAITSDKGLGYFLIFIPPEGSARMISSIVPAFSRWRMVLAMSLGLPSPCVMTMTELQCFLTALRGPAIIFPSSVAPMARLTAFSMYAVFP